MEHTGGCAYPTPVGKVDIEVRRKPGQFRPTPLARRPSAGNGDDAAVDLLPLVRRKCDLMHGTCSRGDARHRIVRGVFVREVKHDTGHGATHPGLKSKAIPEAGVAIEAGGRLRGSEPAEELLWRANPDIRGRPILRRSGKASVRVSCRMH